MRRPFPRPCRATVCVRALTILLALLVTASLVVLALNIGRECRLVRGYRARDDVYDYAGALREGRLEVAPLLAYGPQAFALPAYDWQLIESPLDLHYYAQPEDATPALTVAAGTALALHRHQLGGESGLGYGLTSLPTADAAWRLAHVPNGEGRVAGPLYYVRYRELVALARQWYRENAPPFASVRLPAHEIQRRLLLEADMMLYGHGVYFSPNLRRPLVDMRLGLLLVLGAVALILRVGAGLRLRRRTRAD